MDVVSTRACSAFGLREIEIAFDPDVTAEQDAAWFSATLERMVAQGSRFEPGQSIQIGGGMAWITERANGALGFEEPDLRSIPLRRVAGLTHSLATLRLQKDVLESFFPTDRIAFASLSHSCIVCNALSDTGAFLMQRAERSRDSDSGWFLGCLEDHDHNVASHLRQVTVYEAIVRLCPGSLPYLALPVGTAVALHPEPRVMYQWQALSPKPGSFFATRHGQAVS